jgi:peptidyl-prolyl cis-trans isomerase C
VRAVVRCALVALFALGLLAGCAPDSQTLARVGNRTIQADDLLATAQALAARGALPPDSAKTKLLNAMIQRELLVLGAQHLGLHRDTTFLAFREKIERDLLRDRIVSGLVPGPIEVSESEVEQLHRWRAQESRARVIFTPSREAAEAALAELRGGIDFALVANRFNPSGFTPPGGDLGFVPPGFLQPPLDDIVRTAVPGHLYGPIEAPPQGWFVVRVEERRPRKTEPLDTERAMLTEVIRQRKQVVSLVRSVDRLKAAYQVHVRRGASQELMARALRSLSDSTGRLPPLSLGEQAATLVDYRGGSYTLGDAYQELQSGTVNRPNFQSLSSVDHWLEARAIDRVLLREASARRYQDDPSLQRALRERLNDYLIEGFYTKEVVLPVQASDEQAALFYARDPQASTSLQQLSALTVTVGDSATAVQLMTNAPRLPGLREAVTAAGIGAPVQSATVQYPTNDPIWTALEPYLRGTPPGGYAGPFGLPTGWLVVQVIDKTQSSPAFEGLPQGARESLRAQATDELRQARLRALTDSLRKEFPVTVYTKRLDRLSLPEPALSLGTLASP